MAPGSVPVRDESTAARYEALIRISNSIRAGKELRDLFDMLVGELGTVISFDAIAQFDEYNKVHWHLGPKCRSSERSPEEPEEETLPRFVYRTQETVVLGTPESEIRYSAFSRKMHELGLKSLCAFPLTTAHRRLGSLVIASAQPNAYCEEEVKFCRLVADQIALAIDDAINFQASERAQQRLQLLLDLTTGVVANLDLRDVLREISAQVRRVMDCDGVGIDLPDPEDGKLRIYALDFPDSHAPVEEGFKPPEDNKISPVRAFRSGEPVLLSGAEIQDQRAREGGIKSLAHVPMKGRSGVVGVLSLGMRREASFCEDDLPFLTQVANQVAIAVENARAYGEVSDQRQKLTLEKLYLEDELRSELKFEEIVGRSDALRRVLEQIETVAP